MGIDKLIKTCEHELREGRIESAAKMIAEVDASSLSIDDRLPLAQLSRRSGLSELGLHFLSPLANHNKGFREATNSEIAEYCMCLRELGLVDEARLRLDQLEGPLNPQVILCEMYLAFSKWDSHHSLKAAETYLDHFEETPYTTGIVKVNQIASLIGLERFQQAKALAQESLVDFQVNSWSRLVSNCHELLAQIYIHGNEKEKALQHLEFTQNIGLTQHIKDSLFVQRWKAVILASETGDESALLEVRKRAKELKHYPTVRAIDYERLRLSPTPSLLNHLFYGTPISGYRQMLKKKFGDPASEFILGQNEKERFDLASGSVNGIPIVEPGSKRLLMLQALTSDFYQPIWLGTLFNRVFPNERFHSERSFPRVHQLIYRTRKWAGEQNLDLSIDENEGTYSVQLRNLSFRIKVDQEINRYDAYLQELKGQLPSDTFSAVDAEHLLKLSKSSTHRVLKYGLERLKLIREGFGRNTRYTLTNLER